jgi:tetratricopeptide (TPR) repeat protein
MDPPQLTLHGRKSIFARTFRERGRGCCHLSRGTAVNFLIGQTVSHYKILERIGEGGMGVVYRARDLRLDRTVALKFLPPDSSRDPHARERFIREAKAASALQHNNICTVHDIDEGADGRMFIVMDCYEGETLDEWLKHGQVSPSEVSRIAAQIVSGMAAAHEQGIIHRDLKPSNIFVTLQGVVKVFDFGLAKPIGSQAITREGMTAGTVLYMSPEQLRGDGVDHRTDIWSFGVILYRMLTGRLPFTADYEQALVYKILSEPHEPVGAAAPGAPAFLAAVAEHCLRKDPGARPQTMAELRDLLEAGHVGRKPFPEVLRTAVFVGAVLVLIAGLVYAGLSHFFWKGSPRAIPRLAVLMFANQTGEEAIDLNRPEIQNRFVSTLSSADGLEIEDGPRLNDLVRERFSSDTPARTDDLYRFLRARGYDYAIEGAITRSSAGGYALQVTCKDTRAFGTVLETFDKASLPREKLTLGGDEMSEEVLEYLKLRVLNVKPEMGIWETGRRYENWAAVAQLDRAYEATLRGDNAGFTASLKKAIELDPKFISPRIWVAPSLEVDPRLANQNLEMLRRLRPTADDFEQAMIDWVEANREHAYGREVACLTRALKNDPENNILQSNLAAAYAGWGDTVRAIQVYVKLMRSGWKFPGIYMSALKYLFRQGRRGAAEEALLLWRSVDTTEHSARLFGWLAAMYAARGDSMLSASCRWRFDSLCIGKGYEADRKESLLGGCFADFGLYAEGEELLRSAIARDPRNHAYHERLGDILAARADTALALREYRAALSLGSSSRGLQLKLGDLYDRKGDLAGAREFYRRFLAHDSTSGEARRARERLKLGQPL